MQQNGPQMAKRGQELAGKLLRRICFYAAPLATVLPVAPLLPASTFGTVALVTSVSTTALAAPVAPLLPVSTFGTVALVGIPLAAPVAPLLGASTFCQCWGLLFCFWHLCILFHASCLRRVVPEVSSIVLPLHAHRIFRL